MGLKGQITLYWILTITLLTIEPYLASVLLAGIGYVLLLGRPIIGLYMALLDISTHTSPVSGSIRLVHCCRLLIVKGRSSIKIVYCCY